MGYYVLIFSFSKKNLCLHIIMSLMCCTEPPLPSSAIMPVSVSNELDGGDFGFRIEWNEPQLPFNDDYLIGYRVFIDGPLSTSRRKRLITEYTTGADERFFIFRNGIPFTDYTVSVEAELRVNGEEVTVTALAPTELTTETGGESFVHPSLPSFPPSQCLILLKTSVLEM